MLLLKYRKLQGGFVMKKCYIALMLALILGLTFASTVLAGDQKLTLSIKEAMENPKVKRLLEENNVKLYWGKQSHPRVKARFGEYKTSKRTNAFLKSKSRACQWALASALLTLQERALKEGGDAVINIRSNIKNREFSSETQYECLAGNMMVNVALKGEVVKLK